MILLEVHNRIIEEVLTLQIESFLRKEKLVEMKTNIVGRWSRLLITEERCHCFDD